MLSSKTETDTGTLMCELPIPGLRPGLQDLEFRDCENPVLDTKTESLGYRSLDTETRPRVSSITDNN
jgi:hypothetical protein